MRQGFVHEAVLAIAPDADERAPGAAITVALCGHWEHEPPCPLAPHHTRVDPVAGALRLTILFATEPSLEDTVRQRINSALAAGSLVGPEGVTTRWQLAGTRVRSPQPDEWEHLDRLALD
jgi:hypothetical protein